MRRNHPRPLRRTALIVGEGFAEVELQRHLKSLLTANRQGCELTIRNARGRGAGHVVQYAIAQMRNAEFDRIGVLLDTDHDWTQATQACARRANVQVFSSDPCLEAWLLRLVGEPVRNGITSAQVKQQFKRFAKAEAHEQGVIADLLTLDALNAAIDRDETLARLVQLIRDP